MDLDIHMARNYYRFLFYFKLLASYDYWWSMIKRLDQIGQALLYFVGIADTFNSALRITHYALKHCSYPINQPIHHTRDCAVDDDGPCYCEHLCSHA